MLRIFFLFFSGIKGPVCNFQRDLLALSAIENTYLCFELVMMMKEKYSMRSVSIS